MINKIQLNNMAFELILTGQKSVAIVPGILVADFAYDSLIIQDSSDISRQISRTVTQVRIYSRAIDLPNDLRKADGFASSLDFIDAMTDLYPDFNPTKPITIIFW